MAKRQPITTDAGDVRVAPIKAPDCENDCDKPQAVVVWLDLRTLGQTVPVGSYCKKCGAEVAKRIRESLPPATPQEPETDHAPDSSP